MVEGDQESGGGAVGLGRQVGVEAVLGQGDQGVPESGAVVTGVPGCPAGTGFPGRLVGDVGVGLWCGAGEGEEGGVEEGAVLGGAAAADPDPAGPVGVDREVSVQVRGAFLAVQRRFESAVDGVGVDHLDQVPTRPGQLGGVEALGVGEHELLPPAAGPLLGRQVLDGGDDHVGLGRGAGARHQGLAGCG